jgi:hypothetical protein
MQPESLMPYLQKPFARYYLEKMEPVENFILYLFKSARHESCIFAAQVLPNGLLTSRFLI